MTKQLEVDIDESTLDNSDVEDLDYDVKEANQWIEIELTCHKSELTKDFTCLKIK